MNNKFIGSLLKKSQLRCGGCGGEDHRLYQHPEEDTIIVACNGCDSCSEINVTSPSIRISWVDDSKGILAVF